MAIFSVKLEPRSAAEFVADKIDEWYRSCVIQKSVDFLGMILSADKIGLFYRLWYSE